MGQKVWQSNQWSVSHEVASSLTNHSLKAAPPTGFALFITDVDLKEGASSTTVSLLDGSGGSTLWQATPAANGEARSHYNIPIKMTSATALCVTNSGTSTNAFIVVNGFVARG